MIEKFWLTVGRNKRNVIGLGVFTCPPWQIANGVPSTVLAPWDPVVTSGADWDPLRVYSLRKEADK